MKTWITIAGPLLGLSLGLGMLLSGQSAAIAWTAGITLLTAMWWIFEPIPIPATSLIPIAVFPLVGVLSAEQVAAAYGDKLILLLLGGFILSSAMERSGAHRRIALNMVHLFGGRSARRLVFGFMAAAAVLSMWISNMATTLMMLPIVMAVIDRVEDRRVGTALLLGTAYAASVGGVGTPIGTPPNLIFMRRYARTTGEEPSFVEWMTWAIPVVVLMIPAVGIWLTRGLRLKRPIEVPHPGQWRAEESRTLTVLRLRPCCGSRGRPGAACPAWKVQTTLGGALGRGRDVPDPQRSRRAAAGLENGRANSVGDPAIVRSGMISPRPLGDRA